MANPVVMQRCDVCNILAPYYADVIVVIGRPPADTRFVGQCRQCKLFICNEHAEGAVCLLPGSALETYRDVIEQTGFVPVVLCCLFHGTPLCQFAERCQVLVSSEVTADPTSVSNAQRYICEPRRYVRALRGLDLARCSGAQEPRTAWPQVKAPEQAIIHALNVGQAEFEKSDRARPASPPGPRLVIR